MSRVIDGATAVLRERAQGTAIEDRPEAGSGTAVWAAFRYHIVVLGGIPNSDLFIFGFISILNSDFFSN